MSVYITDIALQGASQDADVGTTITGTPACPAKYFQGIGEFDLLESYTSIYGKKAFYTIDGFLYDDLKKRLDKSYENSKSVFEAMRFGGEPGSHVPQRQ